MIEQSSDDLILERLKLSAAGLPWSDGRPVSELDRLLAQGALIGRVARPKGGMSLFALVNALHTEALFDAKLSTTLGGMLSTVEASYFSSVMADIVSGRLIVREPINFLRCNGVPEIQSLSSAHEGLASMAILVRFVVKFSEAREWLGVHHEVAIPDWLEGAIRAGEARASKRKAEWPNLFPEGNAKLRDQVARIEMAMAGKGYPPLAVPRKGVAGLRRICMEEHRDAFDTESSFKNAWKQLNRKGLVRVRNYEAYCGNPDGRNKSL